MRHRGRGPSVTVAESNPTQSQRGGADLQYLAVSMADVARKTAANMASDDTPGPGVFTPRKWHLDPGDPLLLLHRATGHDADRQQDILNIALDVARRATMGPWSVPHLAIHKDGSLGRALEWGGGPERAMVDDQMPSYLMVDALLMKRACERPRETDLIRRKMITDARQPTGSEIAIANQTAALLNHYKGAVMASTKTYRDMEMASDAMQVHNQRQQNIGDSPASWHYAQAAMTETQLSAEPEHALRGPAKLAPRESPVATGVMRSAVSATRRDQMEQTEGRAGDFSMAGARRGDMSDRIDAPIEGVRNIGGARVGRQGAHSAFRNAPASDIAMTPALDD